MTVISDLLKVLWLIPVIPFLVVASNEWDNNLDSSKCSLANTTGHQIFFYLYTNRQNKSHFENVTEFEDLANSSLNSDWKTIFLVHGWDTYINSPMIQLVKDGYLNLSDYNVIGVDWSYGANHFFYPTSAACVALVAEWIGMFIENLIKPENGLNVKLENINLVGHSLGAHIAGIVGQYFRIAEDCKTIPVIVGLDPTGPTSVLKNVYTRLDIHDATYVEVIHTSKTYLGLQSLFQLLGIRPVGMPENIGDVDIYPNYGGYQPNCYLYERFLGLCAHSQSYVYFANSLYATKHDAAMAVECEGGLDDIEEMNCSPTNNTFYYMGDPADRMYLSKSNQTSTLGVYFFETEAIVGFWNHCLYYFLIVIPYLVVLLGLAFCIWAVMLYGYRCQKINVEDIDYVSWSMCCARFTAPFKKLQDKFNRTRARCSRSDPNSTPAPSSEDQDRLLDQENPPLPE